MKDKNPSTGTEEKKDGMSDSEQLKLLLCAREGNEEAFAELVQRRYAGTASDQQRLFSAF